MKTLFLLLALVMSIACGGVAEGLSKKQPVLWELVTLARLIRIHQDKEGRLPVSWEELERTTAKASGWGELDPARRVVLLDPPVKLGGRHAGWRAVAMTRDAVRPVRWTSSKRTGQVHGELLEPVHGFAITDLAGDSCSFMTLRPEAARGLLAAEGIAFPEPSGLGPFPYETRYGGPVSWVVPLVEHLLVWALPLAVIAWLVSVFLRSRARFRAGNAGRFSTGPHC